MILADLGQHHQTEFKTHYSARFNITGYNKIVQQEAYDFYKTWTGPDFPSLIAVEIVHPTPFYDDSYAVNSANLGPYGDAITKELLPEIEKRSEVLVKAGRDLLMEDVRVDGKHWRRRCFIRMISMDALRHVRILSTSGPIDC